jgi:hypothetical protein
MFLFTTLITNVKVSEHFHLSNVTISEKRKKNSIGRNVSSMKESLRSDAVP